MEKKLNRQSTQRLKRLQASVDHLQTMVNRINMNELKELIRRDEISVDDYASFGGGSIVFVGRRNANFGSPVENAVMAKMSGRSLKDPLREAMRSVEEMILSAEAQMFQAQQILLAINKPEKAEKERRSASPCDVCMVLPSMKTGMCPECYSEWAAAGCPDRTRWVAYKRHLTNSEGIILVAEQPLGRHTPNT